MDHETIEELVETFVNGNLSSVADALGAMTPHQAAYTALMMAELLGRKEDRASLVRLLENRL